MLVWSDILLVVVDKAGDNRNNDRFYIPGGDGVLNLGFGEEAVGFARHVYTWMGCFYDPDGEIPDRSRQLSSTWTWRRD